MEKQSMAHITQKCPPPPSPLLQPTSTQRLIPPSSKQYAAVCWENITDDQKEISSRPDALSRQRWCSAIQIMWMHRWAHCLIMFLFCIFQAAGSPLQLGVAISDSNFVNLDLSTVCHSGWLCVWTFMKLCLASAHNHVSRRVQRSVSKQQINYNMNILRVSETTEPKVHGQLLWWMMHAQKVNCFLFFAV